MVRGTVHDEAAWSLGGASGNAGMFGTAPALLDFGEELRAGLPGILSRATADAMWTDQLPAVLGASLPTSGAEFGHGLGLSSIDLPCGVTVWGHGGDISGYHSLMAKPFDGPAVSVTFTQSPPPSDSMADDPRGGLLDAVYCPAT